MRHSARTEDLLALLAGTTTDVDVAAKHQVSVTEVQEWRRLFADGLALRRQSRRPLRWVLGGVVAAMLFVSSVAVGQVTCSQTLPSPMTTFCQDAPALAGQVNANFQQLVTWSRQKLGTEGNANIAITGNVTLSNTSNMNFGNGTRQMLTLWNPGYGLGVQASTLYQRSDNNFAWFRGGSHADATLDPGTGGTLVMSLDTSNNLNVTGSVSAAGVGSSGNVYAAGQLQGGTIRHRSCVWRNTGLGNGADNQTHTATCNSGEFAAGWRCDASDRLDGNCGIYCCVP